MNKESLNKALELLDKKNIKYYPLKDFTYDATAVDLSDFESFLSFCCDNNISVVFYEKKEAEFDESQFLTPWNGILVGYIINPKEDSEMERSNNEKDSAITVKEKLNYYESINKESDWKR